MHRALPIGSVCSVTYVPGLVCHPCARPGLSPMCPAWSVTHVPGLVCHPCARPGLLPMCPVRTSVPIHPLSPTTPSSTTCPPLRGGLMVLSCPISLTWGEVASNLTAGGFFFPSGRIS